ncbi:glycosyltransferase [Nocardioides sp. cx-173]|uniref:glycosyltransferase n=1 Tax=Nocardioides sp. cx-173 TaxID=2898796 RepID=UPI001E58DB62|nr:glycosyltransferase [Nocardioides sp. cx-173]MCD4526285.1 glycosyltransferase [Nocardioides sp. cx-173]UGB40507.1 glycosyltransferase [Nocardioides sp. cx-173]
MRTLIVVAELGSGGAETMVDTLARQLTVAGDLVTVASNGGWRADRLAEDGIATLQVPLRSASPVSLLRAVLTIRREVRRRPVDVVHAHNVRAALAASLGTSGLRPRPRLVCTVHGLADADYAPAARLLRRCADVVVAVSADVLDRLRAAGLDESRLRVVENAAPVLPAADRAAARRRLGLAPDREVVLCLARLAPPKRHDLLLDAWAELPGDALLLLAGDGPERGSLERRVRADGLGDRVVLLGDRRDVAELLAASDALVLASDREGLPVSVLEAFSAGVPVVASAVGGLRILDPAAVELVAPGSADELAGGLARVLRDPARRDAMRVAARAVGERRFTSTAMVAAYRDLYLTFGTRRPSRHVG